jgi:hypothetical protein
MKKTFISLFLVTFIGFSLQAQEAKPDSVKYWTIGGLTSFNFNQVSLTNWAAGGKNSIAGTFLYKNHFNYKKEKHAWDNLVDFGYGMTKQGTDNAMKTEDKLQLNSKYGYSAGKSWYYSALVDFKTQVDKGYKDPPTNSVLISRWLSPAYVTASLGMDYKPTPNFSLYLSPLTSKMTIVNDEELSAAGAYGVDPGETLRAEYGAFVKMIAQKKDLVKNVDFSTSVDLFSNLIDDPQNIDVNWQAALNMKINEYMSAVLSVNMLYDDNTKYIDAEGLEHGARTQFKQLFGVGVNYKFGK